MSRSGAVEASSLSVADSTEHPGSRLDCGASCPICSTG